MEGAPEEALDPGLRGASPMADGRDHHSSEPPLSPIPSVRVLKRIPRAESSEEDPKGLQGSGRFEASYCSGGCGEQE